MKIEKKLQRGLADLSSFFSTESIFHSELAPAANPEIKNLSSPPPSENRLPDHRLPRFFGAAFLPVGQSFDTTELVPLIGGLKPAFEELYFLSMSFRQPAAGTSPLQVRFIQEGIALGYLSKGSMEETLEPKTSGTGGLDFCRERKSLVIFDSFFQHGGRNASEQRLLEVLDHGILVVRPVVDELVQAYRRIRFCLQRNPGLQCFLIVAGDGAENLSAVVYERFSEILSQFSGSNLGFLGWAEKGKIRLNPHILSEDSKVFHSLSFNARFSKILNAYPLKPPVEENPFMPLSSDRRMTG